MNNKTDCTKESHQDTAGSEKSDSEDDDLLNFVPFPNKKNTYSNALSTSMTATLQGNTVSMSPSDISPCKVRDDGDKEGLDCIKGNAEKRARIAPIPDSIKDPSELHWHTFCRKGKRVHEPCRECHPDEALGLDIKQDFDPKKMVVVQYIEWCTLAHRALVSKQSLTPYYGGDINIHKKRKKVKSKKQAKEQNAPDSSVWCPERMMLLKRERKKKWEPVKVLTEEVYLKRILDYAMDMRQKERQVENTDSKDVFVLSHVKSSQQPVSSSEVVESRDTNSDSSDDDSEVVKKKIKTEFIRCGDEIEYYSPIYAFGDDRGRKIATVAAINPKANPVIELSNGDALPSETLVKRVRIMVRGKLHDNQDKGKFSQIQSYKLRKDVKNAGKFTGIKKEANRCSEILVRNRETYKRKLQDDGLGAYADMMTRLK